MMGGDGAFVSLPEAITLSLEEARTVLAGLDHGGDLAAPSSAAMYALRAAGRVIVGKLWPELGELLEDDDG